WLLLNAGNGTFVDATGKAGIDNPGWGASAAFVDIDRDDWLDLVIANYLQYDDTKPCMDDAGQRDFCGPFSFDGATARLFRNRGLTRPPTGSGAPAHVAFEDISVEAGLASATGAGMGVVVADADGDRWPDILIANDGRANHLWMNQRDGTFRDEAVMRGVAFNAVGRAEANMGIAVGDPDGNGLFDLFITHLTDETHRLWMQVEPGVFTDGTTAAGLMNAPRSTGFGTMFADFDHDGAEDLVVVNGRVSRPRETVAATTATVDWSPYTERNFLYRNTGAGTFEDISALSPALGGTAGVYRAVVAADLDNDGRLDLVVTRLDGPPVLLRNVVASQGHWVMVRTVDPALGRDAQGAVLTVVAGGQRWRRWMHPAVGYMSSGDPRAHVGLGDASRIDTFEVRWPDGTDEVFPGSDADRVVTLEKGTGRPR
ncbi:MAG: CRTAC1 family protein, partial [Vicinamibacteria bacterium]